MNYGELQKLSQRIEMHPRDSDAYFSRGQLLEAHNLLEEARKDYQKALKINPKHFQTYMSNTLLEEKMKKKQKQNISQSADPKETQNKTSQSSSKIFPIISSIGKIIIEDFQQAQNIIDSQIIFFNNNQNDNWTQQQPRDLGQHNQNDEKSNQSSQKSNKQNSLKSKQEDEIPLFKNSQENLWRQQNFVSEKPKQQQLTKLTNDQDFLIPIQHQLEEINNRIINFDAIRIRPELDDPIRKDESLVGKGGFKFYNSNGSGQKKPDDDDHGNSNGSMSENQKIYFKTILWEVYNYLGVCHYLINDQEFLKQDSDEIGIDLLKKAISKIKDIGEQEMQNLFQYQYTDFLNMNYVLETLRKPNKTRFQQMIQNFKSIVGDFDDLSDLFQLVKIVAQKLTNMLKNEDQQVDELGPSLTQLAEKFLKRKILQNPDFMKTICKKGVIHGFSFLKKLEFGLEYDLKDLPDLVKFIINKGAEYLRDFLIQKFKELSVFWYYCCCFCCYYCCCCCCCIPQMLETTVERISEKFKFEEDDDENQVKKMSN